MMKKQFRALLIVCGAMSLVTGVPRIVHADATLNGIQAEFERDLRRVSGELDNARMSILDHESAIQGFTGGDHDTNPMFLDLERGCNATCRPEKGGCTEAVFRDAFSVPPGEDLRLEERILTSGKSVCGIISMAFPDQGEIPLSCLRALQKCHKARETRAAAYRGKIAGLRAEVEALERKKRELMNQFVDTLLRLGFKPERPFMDPSNRYNPGSQFCSWLSLPLVLHVPHATPRPGYPW